MNLALFKNTKIQSIGLILTTKVCFVLMMTLVKFLKHYSPLQLNFMRALVVLIMVLPCLLLTKGLRSFKTEQPLFQMIRVFLSLSSMLCFFYGYRMLPIGKASAINFSYALIVPVFAAFFLKEKISLSRWGFLILGYIGVLVIINPIFETFELAEFIVLLGVILLAAMSIFLKQLTRTDESLILVFYSAAATSFLLGIYFIAEILFHIREVSSWTPLQWGQDGFILMAMGSLSFLGQLTYIQAYKKGRLNFLAGFDYLKFLLASLVGFWFFKESFEASSFYGAFIILVSSYAITREELKNKD